MQEIIFVV
jgi:hypothetical protein